MQLNPARVQRRRRLKPASIHESSGATDNGTATVGDSPKGRIQSRDERGEVLPVAILFMAVLFTILIGVHVVVLAMARTAVQAAADAAVAAAQAAGPGAQECDGDATTMETARECEGILAARVAIAGAKSSII